MSFTYKASTEVGVMVNEFFVQGKLPKGFSSYFVAMIPKINNPQCLIEFRPISLLGILYKIISRMLAYRLKRVLDPIIPCKQLAFLKNRNILECVFSGKCLVLVNGSPIKEFSIQKGLKQRDPLAPFLFLMVA